MRSLWRRLETCLEQHLAHGSRRNRDPETLELADDPFVSPVRVLPSETKDQLAERALEPWSPRPPVRVCPPAGDQLAVPAKQCLRLEQEGPRPSREASGSATSAARDLLVSASAARPGGGGSPAHGGGRGSPTPWNDADAPAATPARTGSGQRDIRTTRASSLPRRWQERRT